jgi:hypothetical protein
MTKNKKRCRCLRRCKKKCPRQFTDCEGAQCQEIRNMIESEGYDAQTNIVYNYTQKNRCFQQAVDYCQNLGSGFRMANLSELSLLHHRFIYIDEDGNTQACPTLVWSTENGNPVIVRIAPCNGEEIEIIRKFNMKKCKVQVICVSPASG